VVKLTFLAIWTGLVVLANTLGDLEASSVVLYSIAGVLGVLVVFAVLVGRSKPPA